MKSLLKFTVVTLLLLRILSFDNSLPEGKHIQISGRINKEVIYYDYYQKIFIQGQDIYLDKYPKLKYGDFVVVQGFVKEGELDQVSLVSSEPASGVYLIRSKLVNLIQRHLPTKDAALITGVLLGSKQLLTDSFKETLVNSGTIHVVVASGTNVTLTASFLISILVLFINRRLAIPIALMGVWTYVILSGFDPPLIRAAVMGSIVFIAQGLGRVTESLTILIYSIFIMLFINPSWLSDVGFQLSFVATLSLILFEAFLNSRLHFVPSILRQDLSTSISAQIGVAPILLHYFGRLSLISPFVNMLVLWTISPMMIIAAVVSLLSLIYEPLSILYLLTMPFTKTFIFIVELFA